MGKLQLSGSNYIVEDYTQKTKAGAWTTEVASKTFTYCRDNYCLNENEHEYVFDGQFFYHKAVAIAMALGDYDG